MRVRCTVYILSFYILLLLAKLKRIQKDCKDLKNHVSRKDGYSNFS